jgi:hypothetical protein
MFVMIKLRGEYVLEMLVIFYLKFVSSAFQNAEGHFVRCVTFATRFCGPERRFIILTEWCKLQTTDNGSGQESCCG